MRGFWASRSTGDILVLVIAFTVCGYVVASGTTVTILLFMDTDADLTSAARNIADVINTLIGLLGGFLAGRSETLRRPPPGEPKHSTEAAE